MNHISLDSIKTLLSMVLMCDIFAALPVNMSVLQTALSLLGGCSNGGRAADEANLRLQEGSKGKTVGKGDASGVSKRGMKYCGVEMAADNGRRAKQVQVGESVMTP